MWTVVHKRSYILINKNFISSHWYFPWYLVFLQDRQCIYIYVKVLITPKTLASLNMSWPWLWQQVKQVKVMWSISFIFNVRILHFCKKVLQRVSNKNNIQHNEISKNYCSSEESEEYITHLLRFRLWFWCRAEFSPL